jgi:hypothetical protein
MNGMTGIRPICKQRQEIMKRSKEKEEEEKEEEEGDL